MTKTIALPTKTREMHNHHFDSTIWNDFRFRHDDIVISTYAKSGTTWTQQIVAQLLFGPDPNLAVAEMSPWLDLRIPPKEVKLPMVEAQTHRRFLKTHLPLDALLFSPEAKYIYIGRDGHPFWSFWENVRSWWEGRSMLSTRPADNRPTGYTRGYIKGRAQHEHADGVMPWGRWRTQDR